MIAIVEDYRDYQPPAWLRRAVEKLVASLPKRCQAEIGAVILTNATAIGRGKTRRRQGRKYFRRDCCGFYHPADERGNPRIEIVVDNALDDFPLWALKIPVIREVALASVLFHEVGHHLNATVGSIAKGEESAADAWRRRLGTTYFRRHHGYLKPFVWLLGRMATKRVRAALHGR